MGRVLRREQLSDAVWKSRGEGYAGCGREVTRIGADRAMKLVQVRSLPINRTLSRKKSWSYGQYDQEICCRARRQVHRRADAGPRGRKNRRRIMRPFC